MLLSTSQLPNTYSRMWNSYAGSHSGIAAFKVFIDRVWQIKRERKRGILQICFYVESNPHEPGSCAQACHLRCLATLRNNDTTSDSSRSDFLRGSDCKYRESADKLKKSKILITCQKNTFGELSSKILLKPSGILLFSGNSEKRFCLIYYTIIRLKIKQIESSSF